MEKDSRALSVKEYLSLAEIMKAGESKGSIGWVSKTITNTPIFPSDMSCKRSTVPRKAR